MNNKNIIEVLNKFKHNRNKKRWVALLSAVVLFVTTNRLVMPADTLERGVPGGAIYAEDAEAMMEESVTAEPAEEIVTAEAVEATPAESGEWQTLGDAEPEAGETSENASVDPTDALPPEPEAPPEEAMPQESDASTETETPAAEPVEEEQRELPDETPEELGALPDELLTPEVPEDDARPDDATSPEAVDAAIEDTPAPEAAVVPDVTETTPEDAEPAPEDAEQTPEDIVQMPEDAEPTPELASEAPEIVSEIIPEATPEAASEAPESVPEIVPEATPEAASEASEIDPEATPEADPETPEAEADIPVFYRADIDLTDAAAPFSLRTWMAQAIPAKDEEPGALPEETEKPEEDENESPAEAEGDETESTGETSGPSVETWKIAYDAAALAIVLAGEDYSVTPLAGFERTEVEVDTGAARYALSLYNYALEPAAEGEEAAEEPVEEIEETPEPVLTGDIALAVEGADYALSVHVPEAANLPAGATFEAKAIEDEACAEAALGDTEGTLLALFDLTIYDGEGAALRPEAALEVSVDLGNALEPDMAVRAVHFPGTGPQPAPAPTMKKAAMKRAAVQSAATLSAAPDAETLEARVESGVVRFSADSFSYYALVGYTVDFHWDVDGQEYPYSIDGGGFIGLSTLVRALGIAGDDDAAWALVRDVAEASFSDDTLVCVTHVEQDTTVGVLKDALGLMCEYSAALSETDIAQIDAAPVTAGDWALISLRPFNTSETLTVTMKNGEYFTVRVTDAAGDIIYEIKDPSGNGGNGSLSRSSDDSNAVKGCTATPNASSYFLCWVDSSSNVVSLSQEFFPAIAGTYTAYLVSNARQRVVATVNSEVMGKLHSNQNVSHENEITNTVFGSGGNNIFIVPKAGYELTKSTIDDSPVEKYAGKLNGYNYISKAMATVDSGDNKMTIIVFFQPTTANTAQITYQTALLDYDGATVLTAPAPGALADSSDGGSIAVAGIPSGTDVRIAKSDKIMVDENSKKVIDSFGVTAGAPAAGYSFVGWKLNGLDGETLGTSENSTIALEDVWTGSDISLIAVYQKDPPAKKIKVNFGVITRTDNGVDQFEGPAGTGGTFDTSTVGDSIIINESTGEVTDAAGNVIPGFNALTGFKLSSSNNDAETYSFGGWYGRSSDTERFNDLTKFSSGESDYSYKKENFTVENLQGKTPYKKQREANPLGMVEIDLFALYAKKLTIRYQGLILNSSLISDSYSADDFKVDDAPYLKVYGTADPANSSDWMSAFSETVSYTTENKYKAVGAEAGRTSSAYYRGFLGWYDKDYQLVSRDPGFTPSDDQIFDNAVYYAVTANASGARFIYRIAGEDAGAAFENIIADNIYANSAGDDGKVDPTDGCMVYKWTYTAPSGVEREIKRDGESIAEKSLTRASALACLDLTGWPNGFNIFTAYTRFAAPTISYVSGNPDMGEVTVESEQLVAIDGTLGGSEARETAGHFDGWFFDGALISTDAAYQPSREDIDRFLAYCTENNTDQITVTAEFNNKPRYAVRYAAEGAGSVSNNADALAGSNLARGSVATPDAGYDFFGWYIGERLLSTDETITAADLIEWIDARYISADDTVITAKFGHSHRITYQRQLDDGAPAALSDPEVVTVDAPKGYAAETLPGYNFLGWYRDDALVTDSPTLTAAHIGEVTSDATYTAKYATARVATYAVEHLNAAKAGVSAYGQIIVGGSATTTSASQTASVENKLTGGATAIPARGCAFTGWTVKNGAGEEIAIEGFDPGAAVIPAGLEIPSDVTFTARFKKQEGAMEIIYTIQEDDTPYSHAARLMVGDRSVEGYERKTAYISEVVPDGQAALGCSAEGLEYGGQQYQIRGWVLGDDNAPNKDTLFTRTSSFTPVGEYLEDVNGDGVRYFRVVTKKSKNIYIIFKTNIEGAGSIGHTSDESRLNVLIYVNSEDAPSHRSHDEIFKNITVTQVDEKGNEKQVESRGLSWNNVYVNSGYKLVGFTYNGVDLDLVTPISAVNAGALEAEKFTIEETAGCTDLITYMDQNSELYLVPETTSVERHVNILIARYELEGYNIAYHVKGGVGGSVSNDADGYTVLEKANGKKDNGAKLINGSTAIPDTDGDYVFVRWEDANGHTVSTSPKYAPDVDEITETDRTYHYYAVFEKRDKLTVRYVPDDPSHGLTSPPQEIVYHGIAAHGSTATAFEDYVFTHWTRQGSEEILSTDPDFTPNVYGVSEDDADHVTEADFDAKQPVTFVAHFERKINTRLTVKKVVDVADGLESDAVDTVIYIALTRNGQDVLDEDGQLLIREITVENGVALNDAVFEGLAYNDLSDANDKYEVWEMHRIGSVYERQYEGMLIGEDYQLSGISTRNDSKYENGSFGDGSGNNALLTEEHKNASVTLTNTYSRETETTGFTVAKEWRNGANGADHTPPEGASVEITVYSETASKGQTVTRAVKSITLDGTPDDKGETAAWTASFANLPKLTEGGRYKVRETGLWPGYTPYIDSGRTQQLPNTYMYNSGGKIINVADDTERTGTLSLAKSFSVPDAYADAVNGEYAFTLTGIAGTATAGVDKVVALTVSDGAVSSAAIRDAGQDASDAVRLSVASGVVSVPGLPVGEYALAEDKTDTITRTVNGRDTTLLWTVSGTEDDVTISVGDETRVSVVNTFSTVAVVLNKVGVNNMDANATETPLSGATFKIHIGAPNGPTLTDGTFTSSGESGTFFDGGLPLGTYYLEETATPGGYNTPAGNFVLTVAESGVTIAGDWISGSAGSKAGTVSVSDGAYIVSVRNTTGYALPSTGGPGDAPFTACGLALIAVALLLLLRRWAY